MASGLRSKCCDDLATFDGNKRLLLSSDVMSADHAFYDSDADKITIMLVVNTERLVDIKFVANHAAQYTHR